MPQFQSYTLEQDGATQAAGQQYIIAGIVQDDDGNDVADFTGENALSINLGGVFLTLTEPQKALIVTDEMAQMILKFKAGI